MTEREFNTAAFQVERSADGLAFSQLSAQPAAGNSDDRLRYQDQDEQPLPGRSYYRLKQIDTDGRFTYSPVVEVNFQPGAVSPTIYPNPSNGQQLSLNIPGGTSAPVQLSVYDLTGKRLWTQRLQPGSQWQLSFSQPLPAGQYVLSGSGPGLAFSKRFVVR
jgi:hypothetical protein